TQTHHNTAPHTHTLLSTQAPLKPEPWASLAESKPRTEETAKHFPRDSHTHTHTLTHPYSTTPVNTSQGLIKLRVLTRSFQTLSLRLSRCLQQIFPPLSSYQTRSFFKVCLKCWLGFMPMYRCMHCGH